MKFTTPYSVLILLLAMHVSASHAHHDISSDMDLAAPTQIIGQITAINWGEPHSTLQLQLQLQRDGLPVQEWLIQMDSISDLAEVDFSAGEFQVGEWVAVILFVAQGTSCNDRCIGYGLSLTDEDNNSYTISQEVYRLFVEFRGRSA